MPRMYTPTSTVFIPHRPATLKGRAAKATVVAALLATMFVPLGAPRFRARSAVQDPTVTHPVGRK